ncbi:hypothetical protein DPMN_076881 [Dreissena polymorpha]|uniref:B box-type domain-containing protein n=1 Tax=Dreissena polymorpha TaxID=45954 RepID=A0A9D3YN63_DREPO|nr:hypothetical protein DPMN_076881 [Dreissena polymorpha]
MICAKCYIRGDENGAVGICKEGKYYLCGECVTEHRKIEEFSKHEIAFFYCATKLKVNKLVRANSFCLDCGQYLCEKCKMDHRGFRIYRRHTFIGGKSIPGMVFNHDEVCGREILQSRSTSTRLNRQVIV